MDQNEQNDLSQKNTEKHQEIQTETKEGFYSRNRFKILGIIVGAILVFTATIISFNLFLFADNSFAGLGGILILTLIRIIFIVVGTPVAIILFFVGHRIDDTNNKTLYRYPIWIEITGMIVGICLGWGLAILWAIILSVSQGLIWANPILYVPFPIITPLITYLCFKGAQFIYSFIDRKFRKDSFKPALIILICFSPFLIYSGHLLSQLAQQTTYQQNSALTDFKETEQGDSYIFTANIYVPETGEYHITATIGPSPQTPSAGTLRLDGIENIDRLNNYDLTKGENKLIYYPDNGDCPLAKTSTFQTYVTFNVSKVLPNQSTLGQPKVIRQDITCHQL